MPWPRAQFDAWRRTMDASVIHASRVGGVFRSGDAIRRRHVSQDQVGVGTRGVRLSHRRSPKKLIERLESSWRRGFRGLGAKWPDRAVPSGRDIDFVIDNPHWSASNLKDRSVTYFNRDIGDNGMTVAVGDRGVMSARYGAPSKVWGYDPRIWEYGP